MSDNKQFEQEVYAILEQIKDDSGVSEFFFNDEFTTDVSIYDYEENINLKNLFRDVGITVVCDACHGGEGKGDEYWKVYSFSRGVYDKVHIKFDGWYASYNGSEFSEYFTVFPEETTITVYTRK